MREKVKVLPVQLGADCCYLLVSDGAGASAKRHRAVLIDVGQALPRRLVKRALHKTGVPLGAIELIVITHAHWDHFGCAAALRELTGAKVGVQAAERQRVEQGEKVMPAAVSPCGRTFGALLKAALPLVPLPPCPVDVVVEDELSLRDYGIAGVALHTRGTRPDR